jgi:HSP20 family protein
MAALTRWTPFREAWRFQDDLNRLFELSNRDSEALTNGWVPPVDIYEDAEGVTLKAEVPGLAPNEIDVRVENNTLTFKGERKLEREDKKDNYKRVERYYGTFTRSFSLPPTVDTEKVRAEHKNGVLSIFLPKREETKPKQIRVAVN